MTAPHRSKPAIGSSHPLLLLLALRLLCSCQYSAWGLTSLERNARTIAGNGSPSPFHRRRHSMLDVAAAPASATETSDAELKDYRGEASSLFGNVRIPAALFAGASTGASFAMPLAMGEGLRLGLVKRVYALLMMGALSSAIVSVVVSTLSVASLSTNTTPKTYSLNQLIQEHYELEWASTRFNFLSAVLYFILGIGLRAWVSISCPIIAKAALGLILSSTLLCLAFIQEVERKSPTFFTAGLLQVPLRYFRALLARARRQPLFTIALVMSMVTWGYIIASVPHVVKYLSKPL